MSSLKNLPLDADDLDDLVYFSRIGDNRALEEVLGNLGTTYSTSVREIVEGAVDPSEPTPQTAKITSKPSIGLLPRGNTLLHYPAANGHPETLRYLISILGTAGSNDRPSLLNHVNESGNTALHWAALNGHLESVKILVEKGADLDMKNDAGRDILREAREGAIKETLVFEQAHGPESNNGVESGLEVVEWLVVHCGKRDLSVQGDADDQDVPDSVEEAAESLNGNAT